MPGDVAPLLVTVLGLVQVDREARAALRSDRAIGQVEHRRGAVELRAFLEFVVVVMAVPAGDGQYFRNQVEVEGDETRGLAVAAQIIFAECGVGSRAQAGIVRISTREGPDGR